MQFVQIERKKCMNHLKGDFLGIFLLFLGEEFCNKFQVAEFLVCTFLIFALNSTQEIASANHCAIQLVIQDLSNA